MIPAVNFHLWEPCNMRCKFCFASFQDVKKTILPKGHLDKESAIKVIDQLAEFGFNKITFAGGEATLCPWLIDLVTTAKNHNMTTMLVTNGTKLTNEYLNDLKGLLDWVTISIDSINLETNLKTGRAYRGIEAPHLVQYMDLLDRVKNNGFGLKINTVVTKENFREDISDLIEYAEPFRWKIFQVLPVKGQNDNGIDNLIISSKEFQEFVQINQIKKETIKVITESNELMTGSYVMVDPAGRFFDNVKGEYRYSSPILEIGVVSAIQQVEINYERFTKREGLYNWIK